MAPKEAPTMSKLVKRYPGAALITGASAGIGAAFARRLAAEGFDVALVARRAETMEELAADIRAAHGVHAHVIAVDLAEPDGPAKVKAATDDLGLEVGFLVNNAGYGTWGAFHRQDPAVEARMIDLNCRAVMLMAALYTPAMIAKKRGAMIVTASTAAFQPCPHFATYAATKTFDLMFASALWSELKPHGVDVVAVCPGYTRTEFQAAAGIDKEFSGPWRKPEHVVDTALYNLGKGPTAIDGLINGVMARGVKFVPERLAIAMAGAVLKRL
jgi:short-subunit dehydrogenase